MDKTTCDSISGTFSGDPTKIGMCCVKGAPLNSVDNMCCPFGATFTIDSQKNGICCPYGTTFKQGTGTNPGTCQPNTSPDTAGDGQSCPQDITLNIDSSCPEDLTLNINVSCPQELTLHDGTTCPPGATVNPDDGSCCPYGSTLNKDQNGATICCNHGATFFSDAQGDGVCCPQGYVTHTDSSGDKSCCQPNDTFDADSGICCPQGVPFNSDTVMCCPKAGTFHPNPNGAGVCCATNEKFYTDNKGNGVCCDASLHFSKVNGVCCQKGDQIEGSSNTAYPGAYCCKAGTTPWPALPACMWEATVLICGAGQDKNIATAKCCDTTTPQYMGTGANAQCCPIIDPTVQTDKVGYACCPIGATANSYAGPAATTGPSTCCPVGQLYSNVLDSSGNPTCCDIGQGLNSCVEGAYYNASTQVCCAVGQGLSDDKKTCCTAGVAGCSPALPKDSAHVQNYCVDLRLSQMDVSRDLMERLECCGVGKIAYKTSTETTCCNEEDVFYYSNAGGGGYCTPVGAGPHGSSDGQCRDPKSAQGACDPGLTCCSGLCQMQCPSETQETCDDH